MSYLLNAIPGTMVPQTGIVLSIIPIRPDEVPADVISAIGHADTAAVVTSLLSFIVPMARVNVPAYAPGDIHYLALYSGPRLPEGSTTLPEGASINFFRLAAYAQEQVYTAPVGSHPCLDPMCYSGCHEH